MLRITRVAALQRMPPSLRPSLRYYSVTPWYVTEALRSAEEVSSQAVDLPTLPPSSPESLSRVIKFAMTDLGLKDVTVIDKRDDFSALGPCLMVLGTGTSGKHLGSAAGLLKTWLKQEFGVLPDREGILTTNFLKLHNSRQKRRQQRHRTATEDTQLDRIGSWVAVDTKVDNIYMHLMTSERRMEIDLEHLGDAEEDEEVELPRQKYASPTARLSSKRSYSTKAMPSSREELALYNLAHDKREDLTEESPEVSEFVKFFPHVATRAQWRARLEFFALATVQSSLFSVQRLVDEAEFQQASGILLDEADVERVISAICYHGQSHFATLSRDDQSVAAWKSMCNEKALLIARFYDFALRPLGRSLLTNPRLLTLLYRTFTGLCLESTTPVQALEMSASPAPVEVFMDVERSVALRYLLETTNEMKNLQTVGMLLTSLCTRDTFDAFWKTCEIATVTAANTEFSEHLVGLAVSLIVRTGDRAQITYVIQSYLPNLLMAGTVRLTPQIVDSLSAGLDIVDSEHTGFASARKIVAQYKSSLEEESLGTATEVPSV